MNPTTERQRVFRVLNRDGDVFSCYADTICDVNGYGTFLRFKRDGEVVGETQGDIHGWWLDDGAVGKTWRLKIAGHDVEIVADARKRTDEPRPCERFIRSGEIVAAVYTDYHTWTVDG
ncbi:MAG: hypothetical protein F4027_01320 [Rhodospirillaceae bacterium]|nr:hypothetical protein [Rhodospirillaceae bacterium]MYK57298.1 hypothetical protein [Rhodospirillaceae bacterium]